MFLCNDIYIYINYNSIYIIYRIYINHRNYINYINKNSIQININF